jgi:hypothetical protein
MMIESILSAMKIGKVKLEYTSLVSGKKKEITGTLQGDKWILQHATSDNITFWDTKNEKWESIQCNTINRWVNEEEKERAV